MSRQPGGTVTRIHAMFAPSLRSPAPLHRAHPYAHDESERLGVLNRYRILDTPPCEAFQRVARLAASICQSPVAMVNFIDANRQWTKAAHGTEALAIPRSHSFCTHTITEEGLVVVEDTRLDERFLANPQVVDEPGIRFYAGVPLRSPEGHGLGTLCVIDFRPRTLSETQRAQLADLGALASRELEQRRAGAAVDDVFMQLPAPMFVYEIETLRILNANEHALQEYGYSQAEFLSLRLTDLRPPADVPALLQEVARAEPDPYRGGPFRHRRADGSVLHVHIASQAIAYQGRPARLVLVTDVTEQLTWQRAHRATEERFKLLVDTVEEYAIVLLDPVGRVVSWNRGARRLYGFEEDDVLGRPAVDLFPAGDAARHDLSERLRAAGAERPYRTEALQVRKDGSEFWADVVTTPLRDEQNNVLGYVQITRDITLRLAHDKALIEARLRAERLSKMKSSYLTKLSHDVRTPLTGILGAAEILAEEGPTDTREFASSIHRNGQYLLEALDTTLEFVHLENETDRLKSESFDLAAASAEIVARYQARADELGLRLAFEGQDEILAHANPDGLRRALAHVVRNALKFTAEGGVTVRVRPARDHALVEVEDTGIGMTPAFLRTIFEPFAQEDPTFARPLAGNGLGLPIAHRTLERMGGRIAAWSEKGVGSRFTITLPAPRHQG